LHARKFTLTKLVRVLLLCVKITSLIIGYVLGRKAYSQLNSPHMNIKFNNTPGGAFCFLLRGKSSIAYNLFKGMQVQAYTLTTLFEPLHKLLAAALTAYQDKTGILVKYY
jgi:hypothetical protein